MMQMKHFRAALVRAVFHAWRNWFRTTKTTKKKVNYSVERWFASVDTGLLRKNFLAWKLLAHKVESDKKHAENSTYVDELSKQLTAEQENSRQLEERLKEQMQQVATLKDRLQREQEGRQAEVKALSKELGQCKERNGALTAQLQAMTEMQSATVHLTQTVASALHAQWSSAMPSILSMPDLSPLCRSDSGKHELGRSTSSVADDIGQEVQASSVDPAELMKRWVNRQLQLLNHRKPVVNFRQQLRDGEIILKVMKAVLHPKSSEEADRILRKNIDIDTRLDDIVELCNTVTGLDNIILASHFREANEPFMFRLLSRCLVGFPNLPLAEDEQQRLASIVNDFEEWFADIDSFHDIDSINMLQLSVEGALQGWDQWSRVFDARAADWAAVRSSLDNFTNKAMLHSDMAMGSDAELALIATVPAWLIHDLTQSEAPADESPSATVERVMETMQQVNDVLLRHRRVIQDSYSQYSASNEEEGSVVSLDVHEFLTFVRDCLLFRHGPAGFDRHLVMTDIFLRTKRCSELQENWELLKVSGVRSASTRVAVPSESDEADQDLSMPEFVFALVRLASVRIKDSGPIAKRVETLFQNYIWKNAEFRAPGSLREVFVRDSVRNIFRDHRANLLDCFKFYANLDNSAKGASTLDTINRNEFQMLLKDAKLDAHIDSKTADRIFEAVQQADVRGESAEFEMSYSEFLEAVCTMAFYKLPDPLTPFEIRLEEMITKLLEPLATKTKVRLKPRKARKHHIRGRH
jgi:hypothetical protein